MIHAEKIVFGLQDDAFQGNEEGGSGKPSYMVQRDSKTVLNQLWKGTIALI
jgi:hypothetical protein